MRRFLFLVAHFEILAACAVLGGAFWMQFVRWEFPCPLCIIQRMAMLLCLMGPALIIMDGLRQRDVSSGAVMAGYGMSILGALVGLAASGRQVLLHIMPGDTGYGSAVMGMHLYSWAVIVFVTVLLFSGFGLLLCSRWRPQAGGNRRWSMLVLWILGIFILANAVSVFCEAGLHWYLPDNPTSYRLFTGS
ncbi:MAG: disulfide bond formation protein B [Phycisphaerales bacterium]|jgi:disulfide bond formation protein DsbB|nr:disulfide bond formation protein B [Phycisphaerales bacterium]